MDEKHKQLYEQLGYRGLAVEPSDDAIPTYDTADAVTPTLSGADQVELSPLGPEGVDELECALKLDPLGTAVAALRVEFAHMDSANYLPTWTG